MNLIIGNIALAPLPANLIGMVIIGFIGSSLVLLGLAFLAWRFRARMLANTAATKRACPRCRSSLRRVHRTRWERAMCTLLNLPLGHYRCSNRHCSWQGLQPVRHEHDSRPEPVNSAGSGNAASMAANRVHHPALDLNLPGAHIETGAAPLPAETHPGMEQQPQHELEGSPLAQA